MSATRRMGIVVLAVVVEAGLVIFLWLHNAKDKKASQAQSQTGQAPGISAPPKTAPDFPQMVSALAYFDLHGAELPPEKTVADYARELGNDPARITQEVTKRVALVPYEGSFNSGAGLLQSGAGNSLDRARLVLAILQSAGTEARIVSVDQDDKNLLAQYAAGNPASPSVMRPEAFAELGKEVEDLWPKILAKLKAGPGADWSKVVAAKRAERRLYWAQVKQAGAWVDLIPSDMTIDPAKRQAAQPLSDKALAGLVWQIKLRMVNSVAHKEQEVLSFAASAADLNDVPLTLLNQPDGSLTKFVPRILYGDKSQHGTGFELKPDKALDYQLLKIDVVGPYEQRHFVRTLVSKPGAANPDERELEVATAARVTVICGSVSDEQFERRLAANLAQAGKVLFGKAQDQNAVPVNLASIPAIAVLDSAQRYAGHSGASARLLAFQGRPAVAVEHDYVVAADNALVRRHSFDLLDPGHALFSTDAPTETVAQAAIEQSVVDAWMEDRVAEGDNVLTSRRAVRDLLTDRANLNLARPPSGLESEGYGPVRPAYRLGRAGQTSAIAGWRFDPGPQAVPILGNLTGGTQSDMAQRARVAKLCKAISWGQMVVPASYFPQKFLFSGIVAYDCKLAETYNKATDALNAAFAPLNGSAPDSGSAANDLKNQIEQLGPDLIKDVVKNAIKQAAGGLAIHGLKQYLTPAEESAARPFSERQDPAALDGAMAIASRFLSTGQPLDVIEQQAANGLPH